MSRDIGREPVEAGGVQGAYRDRPEAELLGELAHTINASLDLDTILQAVAEVARALCRSDVARIALREPGSDELVFRYSVGSRSEAYRDVRVGPGRGLAGQVLSTGQPVRTVDIRHDPRMAPEYLSIIRADRSRSVLVVPIRIGERVEGLIYVNNRVVRPFGDREQAALLRLADHAAAAIRNSRLFAAERAAREEAEATQRRLAFLGEVSTLLASSLDYEQTLASLARLAVPMLADLCVIDVRAADGTIQRVAAVHADPGKQALAAVLQERFAPDPDGPHPVAEALRTGRPLFAPEVTEPVLDAIAVDPEHRRLARALAYTSYVVVPLVARGRTLGAISLVSGESGRRYTAADLALAEELARRAALAVDNARLYGESEARRRSAEALTETGRLLSHTLSPTEVAERVVGRVRDLIGATCAVVYRLDRPAGVFRALAVSGQTGRGFTDDIEIPFDMGTIGLAVRERQPVMTPDLLRDPRIVVGPDLAARLASAPHRAGLAVPLIAHGEVIGALFLGDRVGRRFTPDEVRLAENFADQAAIAFSNARLYEGERRARNEAEAANLAKDQFLAMLAHELRNPLAPIRSGIYLIGQRLSTDPIVQRARAIIERQLTHLTRLLDDLLDVARITQGRIELVKAPLELATAVSEAVEATRELAEAKGHSVRVELPRAPLRLEADPTRLVQIIGNLLHNAVKYTPAGGTIVVTARPEPDWVVLAVQDTGIGIPSGMLPRVFDLFAQLDASPARSEGGLGIGLTLVRRLVELHGGQVSARSEGVGRGSEFIVRLPAGVAPASRGPVPPPCAPRQERRVLVVEDNADAAEMLQIALELGGHRVVLAADGPAGVESARRERPDAVLVDIGLPGFDGYEVARRVRAALGPAVLLVALTGYGQPEDQQRAVEAGFDVHLVKPIDPEELAVLVARPRSS